jgi:TRAP-type C4-dicarboxylate transport system permease small subunit
MSKRESAGDPSERQALERRFRWERNLGAAAMLALCVITLANVLARYLTDISFAFTEEVSVFLMVFLTCVGSAKAFFDGGQIAVAWFAEKTGPAWRRRLTIVSLACSAVMFAILVWYGGRMAWDDYQYEVTSPGIGAPQWIYTVWLPLLCLAILVRLLQGLALMAGRRR